jgi:hypothetical protein
MRIRQTSFFACLAAVAGSALVCAQGQEKKEQPPPDKVSYYRDVRPILMKNCQGCHQPAKAEGGVVLTSHAALFKKGDSDVPGIEPGQPAKSMIYTVMVASDGKPPKMPRNKDPLAEPDVSVVQRWIAQGAKNDSPPEGVAIDADHPPIYEQPPVVTALAYSPTGIYLAVSSYHEILVHHADGSGIAARLIGISERIQSLAFSPDGKLLAATGGSPGRFGEVQIWDTGKWKLKLSVPVTFDTVYGASWSPDGTKVAFGCADNSLRAIEAATGKQVLFQGGHSDWVLGTVFSKDGSHLVSVSRDRSMKLTEVASERLIDNITSITPGALKGGLQAIDRHPSKDELLTGGADGIPKLYQMYRTKARKIGDDFNLIRAYDSMPGRIFAVRFDADGTRFAVGSSSSGIGEARVYRTDNAKVLSRLECVHTPIYGVTFAPDGSEVACAGFDGIVYINDPNTGLLRRQFWAAPLAK